MSNAPNESSGSSKRAFWIPNALYNKIRDYVNRHRNAPESMTINAFVREALESKVQEVSEKGKRRGGA
jgi:hypothetical protein